MSDRPTSDDTPIAKTLHRRTDSSQTRQKDSTGAKVGHLVKDLATGGATGLIESIGKQFTSRPDGRTDGGSGR